MNGFDSRLSPILDQLTAHTDTARVMAARVYRVPYARVRVRAALQQPRRVHILEEFILRATELNPPPAPAELPELLGLDSLFVEATLRGLEEVGVVQRTPNALRITKPGQQARAKGQVPQAPEYRALRLLYLSATEELRVWDEQWQPETTATKDPLLPGLPFTEREALATHALAAATLSNVIDALDLARMDWHSPKTGRVLATVDEAAIEEIAFYPCGLIVLQRPDESVVARVVRLPGLQPDATLEEVVNQWLAAGRLNLDKLLPDAVADGSAVVDDPYRVLAANPGSGVERIPPEAIETRLAQFVGEAQQNFLVLQPTLTANSLPANLGQLGEGGPLATLAQRGVFTILGWGGGEKREAEPRPPDAGLVDAFHRLHTPEGYPAVSVWWVGELVGCDLLTDRDALFSTLPDTVSHGGKHYQLGQRAYRVTHIDLVQEALENIEPALARAARQHWQANVKYPQSARVELERCCLTWVAARRPGEALSQLLKLAASGPALLPLAWELFTVTNLALARLPEEVLVEVGAYEALARTVPDLLARDPAPDETATDYLSRVKQLLVYYAEGAPREYAIFLGEMRDLWLKLGLPASPTTAAYFTALEETLATAKEKKKPAARKAPEGPAKPKKLSEAE